MIYVQASGAGALLAWASTEAGLPTPPPNSVVLSLASWDAPPPPPYRWVPELLDFAVASVGRLSRLQFRSRYTLAEQVAIAVMTETHADPVVRATLRVLDAALSQAEDVHTRDPRTVQGVQYHASLGVIAAGRVAEILA